MRAAITEDQFNEQVLSGPPATPQEHRAVAEQLIEWAEQPHPADEVGPRPLWLEAGAQLELADDAEGALTAYRRALAAAGETVLDPRCLLVHLHLRRGEPDEADRLDHELRRSRPESSAVYMDMGEVWQEHGQTARAVAWLTRGILQAERGLFTDHEMGRLCLMRYQLRQEQGEGIDPYDEVAMDFIEHHAARSSSQEDGRG